MSDPVIFKDLPATFPERDKYKKPSLVTSLLVHAVLLVVLLTVPFLFLERISDYQLLTVLVAPPPPPPASPPAPIQIVDALKPVAPRPMTREIPVDGALIMPTVVPDEIARIIDVPESSDGVIGGVPGGLPGGVAGGVLGRILAGSIQQEFLATPPPPPPPPKALEQQELYRVGGDVKEPRLIKLVPPKYPSLAKQSRVQGTVVLEATLREDGTVDAIRVISGHPLLVNAAIDSVKQWRYEPTLLNGHPVAIVLTAIVTFEQKPVSE
jgi:protein TonB